MREQVKFSVRFRAVGRLFVGWRAIWQRSKTGSNNGAFPFDVWDGRYMIWYQVAQDFCVYDGDGNNRLCLRIQVFAFTPKLNLSTNSEKKERVLFGCYSIRIVPKLGSLGYSIGGGRWCHCPKYTQSKQAFAILCSVSGQSLTGFRAVLSPSPKQRLNRTKKWG